MQVIPIKNSKLDQAIFVRKILSPFGNYVDVVRLN